MRMIHVGRNGQDLGIFPEDQAQALLRSGQLLGTDVAWMEGMSQWVPLSSMMNAPPSAGAMPPGLPPPTFAGTIAYGQAMPPAQNPYAPVHTGRIGWMMALISGFFAHVMFVILIMSIISVMKPIFQQMQSIAATFPPPPGAFNSTQPSSTGPYAPSPWGNPPPGVFAPSSTQPFGIGNNPFGLDQAKMVRLFACEVAWLITSALAVIFLFIMYYKCWKALPPQFRATSPGKAIGFHFIPFFNLFWMFYSVIKLSAGYQDWARAMGRTDFPSVTGWGIAWLVMPFIFQISAMMILLEGGAVIVSVLAAATLWLGIKFFAGIIKQAHELHGVNR